MIALKPTGLAFQFLLVLGLVLVPGCRTTPSKEMAPKADACRHVDVREFESVRTRENHVLLDVRTPEEYAAGHIPGALNIDFTASDFERKVAALPRNHFYLVYCATGRRSAGACTKMTDLGFSRMLHLQDGYSDWVQMRQPQR
jgi:phage shock protein E